MKLFPRTVPCVWITLGLVLTLEQTEQVRARLTKLEYSHHFSPVLLPCSNRIAHIAASLSRSNNLLALFPPQLPLQFFQELRPYTWLSNLMENDLQIQKLLSGDQEIAQALSPWEIRPCTKKSKDTYLLFNNFRRKRLLRDHPKCPSASVFV